MKISVIVPCHNGEKYVEGCLRTLASQTYKYLEIIIVDDGSSDRSLSVIEQAIASMMPTVLLIKQSHKGVSASRNVGMDHASGDYIHFLDIDDEINSEFYEMLAETAKTTASDIVACNVINEAKPHRNISYEVTEIVTSTEERLGLTNVGRRGSAWRFLFRLDFLKEHGLRFDETRISGEDRVFSLQAVYFAQSVATEPRATYYYRKNEGSIMNTQSAELKKRRHADWQRVKEFYISFAEEHKIIIPGIPTGKLSRYVLRWFK